MKTIAAAAFGAALLTPGVVLAQDAGKLEVHFCPATEVRTYPLETAHNIQGLMLDNVLVVNHGAASVDLTEIDLALLQKGEVTDERRIAGEPLTKAGKTGPKVQASGVMDLIPGQFCDGALIPKGTQLAGPTLAPGQAMLLIYQTFAYSGVRDSLRVSVHGKAGPQDVAAEASLPIAQGSSKTAFRFPLHGVWFAAVGPTMHTGHRWVIPEQFAFDIARVGEGDLSYRGDGTKFSDYYAYGAEVVAAADGKVIAAVDGIAEDTVILRRPSESDDAYDQRQQGYQTQLLQHGPEAAAGDYVMVDHGNGEFSLYAHLQPGSLKVKPGDVVKAGQTLGKLGASGNASEPHLHFQVCDSPKPVSCTGIPINFTGLRLPYADYPRPPQSGDIVIAD